MSETSTQIRLRDAEVRAEEFFCCFEFAPRKTLAFIHSLRTMNLCRDALAQSIANNQDLVVLEGNKLYNGVVQKLRDGVFLHSVTEDTISVLVDTNDYNSTSKAQIAFHAWNRLLVAGIQVQMVSLPHGQYVFRINNNLGLVSEDRAGHQANERYIPRAERKVEKAVDKVMERNRNIMAFVTPQPH